MGKGDILNYKLTKVNQFLKKKEEQVPEVKETGIILNGPDTIKNILINETIKLNKLEQVSAELLTYLTDSKAMKKLTRKEQQSLLRDIVAIQTNSRDFIFKVAELSTKNEFLKKILELSQGNKEVVISENGEVFESSVSEEDRKRLAEILRDVMNDRTRG